MTQQNAPSKAYIPLLARISINPSNAELNPICHLLALLAAHHIFHVSGLRVNIYSLYGINLYFNLHALFLQRGCVYWKRIPYSSPQTSQINCLIHQNLDHCFPTRVLQNTRNFRINKYKFLNVGKNCKNRSKYVRNFCPAVGNTGAISLSSEMYDWVRNTFVEFSQNSGTLLRLQEEQLTELQCDQALKIKFNDVTCDVFWISIKITYFEISVKPVNISLNSLNFTSVNKLSHVSQILIAKKSTAAKEDLWVYLSKLQPKIKHLWGGRIQVSLKMNLIFSFTMTFMLMFKKILVWFHNWQKQ